MFFVVWRLILTVFPLLIFYKINLKSTANKLFGFSGRSAMDDASDAGTDTFLEAAAPHSEAVIFLARGVGVLVALAAILFAVMLMMVVRAFIGIVLLRVGVSGVFAVAVLTLGLVTKVGNVSPNLVWRILTRSCC